MSVRDGDLPGDEEIVVRGRARRGRLMSGAAGLALVLGGGYLVVAQLADRDAPVVNRAPGALAPMVPVTRSAAATAIDRDGIGPAPAVVGAGGATTAGGAPAAGGAAAGGAAAPGDSGRRAVRAAGDRVDAGAVSTSTRATAEGSIRVTTARADLTGRADLLPAGDGGTPAGDARCTRNLRLGGAGARVMPAVLLCWRTSATRSVITLATGRPTIAGSLAVLDREWARLD